MIRLAQITNADPDAVEALLDRAFGSDRHQRTAYRLRVGVAALPGLSFAAFDDDALVGSIQLWPVELRPAVGPAAPLILVGPIAVEPARQQSGIGKALTMRGLAAAREASEDALVLIGDPEYYGRFFGFSSEATAGWALPGPVERHRLLARVTPELVLPKLASLGPRAFADLGEAA